MEERLANEFAGLIAERDDLQRTLDLVWQANQRGIKAWQAAGEGRELTWPDQAKLVEWLLSERDAARQAHARLREWIRSRHPLQFHNSTWVCSICKGRTTALVHDFPHAPDCPLAPLEEKP